MIYYNCGCGFRSAGWSAQTEAEGHVMETKHTVEAGGRITYDEMKKASVVDEKVGGTDGEC